MIDTIAKGQIISKGNFGVFNSSKTNKLDNFMFCHSLLGKELKKLSSPFEIN